MNYIVNREGTTQEYSLDFIDVPTLIKISSAVKRTYGLTKEEYSRVQEIVEGKPEAQRLKADMVAQEDGYSPLLAELMANMSHGDETSMQRFMSYDTDARPLIDWKSLIELQELGISLLGEEKPSIEEVDSRVHTINYNIVNRKAITKEIYSAAAQCVQGTLVQSVETQEEPQKKM